MLRTLLPWILALALFAIPSFAYLTGSKAGLPDVLGLLRRRAVLARFFLATFVIMPAIVIVIARLTGPGPLAAGLVLMSMTPPGIGAAARGLKLKGDPNTGLAWQAVALLVSVVTIPVTMVVIQRVFHIELLLGFKELSLRVALMYLLPLCIGAVVRRLAPRAADAIEKYFAPVAKVAALALLALVLIVALPGVVALGAKQLGLVVAFVAVAIGVGHLMGGPPAELRPTLASALAMRWIAPALVIAQVNDSVPRILPVLIAYILAAFALTAVYGEIVQRRPPRSSVAAPHPVG